MAKNKLKPMSLENKKIISEAMKRKWASRKIIDLNKVTKT